MLEMTSEAGTAVRKMMDAAGVASSAGLRLLPRADSATSPPDATAAEAPVEVEMPATSVDSEQVITASGSGARVVLDSPGAEVLDTTLLDARRTVQGRVSFLLRPQHT